MGVLPTDATPASAGDTLRRLAKGRTGKVTHQCLSWLGFARQLMGLSDLLPGVREFITFVFLAPAARLSWNLWTTFWEYSAIVL